jgi:tyrosyl-tRNA synthetase
MPTVQVEFPVGLLDVLVASGLCKSKGDARRQVQGGAVKLGADRGQKVDDPNMLLETQTVLWRGKKNCVRLQS